MLPPLLRPAAASLYLGETIFRSPSKYLAPPLSHPFRSLFGKHAQKNEKKNELEKREREREKEAAIVNGCCMRPAHKIQSRVGETQSNPTRAAAKRGRRKRGRKKDTDARPVRQRRPRCSHRYIPIAPSSSAAEPPPPPQSLYFVALLGRKTAMRMAISVYDNKSRKNREGGWGLGGRHAQAKKRTTKRTTDHLCVFLLLSMIIETCKRKPASAEKECRVVAVLGIRRRVNKSLSLSLSLSLEAKETSVAEVHLRLYPRSGYTIATRYLQRCATEKDLVEVVVGLMLGWAWSGRG